MHCVAEVVGLWMNVFSKAYFDYYWNQFELWGGETREHETKATFPLLTPSILNVLPCLHQVAVILIA